MSCNYAEGLSPYHDKGQLGLAERFDNDGVVKVKVDLLAKLINKAKHVVIHTGAGISTSAGIPDFRGPQGVWTLEAKGQKPNISTDFNEAIPTVSHMAIARLIESGKVKYVVSQNIDGLHLRSGLPRKYLSELHGNMFIEQCGSCHRQFVRNKAVPTVGQKCLNRACPTIKPNGRVCRGRLHDTILDWEHNLPENDLAMADFHSCLADLSIAIGTTMQIVPSGSLPLYTKKAGGKLVIINLQPTKHDSKADLLIHGYADEVMVMLMKQLSLRIQKYSAKNDPTQLSLSSDRYFEWTISDAATAQMKKIYEAKCGKNEAKKRLELIEKDEIPLLDRITNKLEKASVVINKVRSKVRDDDDDDVPLYLRVPKQSGKNRKRKSDESNKKPAKKGKRRNESDEDSDDIEVLDETPTTRRRGRPRKSTADTTPPPTKLLIKKSALTPNKTKYEIVRPKQTRVEIVRATDGDDLADLEMVCESDDDSPVIPFITNFKRYLYDDTTFKREQKPTTDVELSPSIPLVKSNEIGTPKSAGAEIKDEIKSEDTVEAHKVVSEIITSLLERIVVDTREDSQDEEVPKEETESAAIPEGEVSDGTTAPESEKCKGAEVLDSVVPANNEEVKSQETSAQCSETNDEVVVAQPQTAEAVAVNQGEDAQTEVMEVDGDCENVSDEKMAAPVEMPGAGNTSERKMADPGETPAAGTENRGEHGPADSLPFADLPSEAMDLGNVECGS